MKKILKWSLAALLLFSCSASFAQQKAMTDSMRGPVPLDQEGKAPEMPKVENKDLRRTRAYSMQPPTIPHSIDNYQLDKNANRCLFCHARNRAEETQSIPLSVTHYMDREGNVLADVSPRRYFCTQCHVTQVEAKPLVKNSFQDVDTVMGRAAQKKTKPK